MVLLHLCQMKRYNQWLLLMNWHAHSFLTQLYLLTVTIYYLGLSSQHHAAHLLHWPSPLLQNLSLKISQLRVGFSEFPKERVSYFSLEILRRRIALGDSFDYLEVFFIKSLLKHSLFCILLAFLVLLKHVYLKLIHFAD